MPGVYTVRVAHVGAITGGEATDDPFSRHSPICQFLRESPAVMRSVRQCWYVLTRPRAPLVLSLGVLLFAGLPDAPVGAPPAVRVRIEVRDRDTRRFVAARFSLADRSGRLHTPAGVTAYHKGSEHHFLAASPFEMELPPGRYRLTVARGAEYRATSVDLDAQAGQSQSVWLERWIDMNSRGWYSGDLHNHRRPDEMPILLAAEDLNLAPTITDWIWEDHPSRCRRRSPTRFAASTTGTYTACSTRRLNGSKPGRVPSHCSG